MKRAVVGLLVACLVAETSVLALGSKKAEYVGGTIPGLKEMTEGRLSTESEQAITFMPEKSALLTIPYTAITGLEYGQKAGRRVAVAVLVSPLAIFSKKRKHYLTITYKDAQEKEQAGVFELGKDVVRTTLTIVEVRSGKKIEYQDEEARKAGKGS